jgi:glycosyltransferase involved in cell wall biosynthesis
MRILFVTLTLPVPISSSRVRPYNLIKHLAERHEVSVISLFQSRERQFLSSLEPYCQRIELVEAGGSRPLGSWHNRIRGWALLLSSSRPRMVHDFPVDRMREPLRRMVEIWNPEVVHFESLFTAELVSEIGGSAAVLGEQNAEFDVIRGRQRLATNPIHRIRDHLAWKRMWAFERQWIQQYPVCLAVTERDAARLQAIKGETEIHVVPNGVACRAFAPPDNGSGRDPNMVLFFGTLNYGPNTEGIIQFCRETWPQIHGSRSGAFLEIVGIDAPPEVQVLGRLPGIKMTGHVPDIRPKLWSAAVSVVPIKWGGGTRLKILEALAAGCPVVSTTVGAEGLDLRDKLEIRIADTCTDFAEAVLHLLDHPGERSVLAEAGQRAVAVQYDWTTITDKLEIAYSRAVELRTNHLHTIVQEHQGPGTRRHSKTRESR